MSDLKNDHFSFRCEATLGERIRHNANAVSNEPGAFVRRCIEEICEMMDDPNNNDLPEIVAMVRYAKTLKQNPIPLNKPRKTA